MFKRGQVSTKKVVEVLTDPNPVFLSLVDHGANQTPFSALKSDTPPVPVGRGAQSQHQPTMSKRATPTTPAKKTDAPEGQAPALVSLESNGSVNVTKGADIHRIEFNKATFKTDAEVTAFLTANGYKDFEIVENGDAGFAIDGIGAESFDAVQKIELPNGVTFHVGKLKDGIADTTTKTDGGDAAGTEGGNVGDAPAGDAAGTEAGAAAPGAGDPPSTQDTAAKGDTVHLIVSKGGQSLSRKFDTWNATTGLTLASLLAAAASDGIPAGYYGVMDCFQTAYANVVRTGNLTLIPSLTAELGDVLTKLATLFSTVVKSDAAGAEALLSINPPTAPSQSTVAKSDAAAAPAATGLTQEDVDKAVKAAVDAMATTLRGELASKQEVQSVQTVATEASASVAKHDTRIARMERVRQVKKSDDAPAPSGGGSQGGQSNGGGSSTSKQEPISKSDANLFGIRTQPGKR